MATLLKRTKLSRYAPNFSNMLFMVIVMASPRGFSDSILEAEKHAKNCPKMVKNGLKFFFSQYLRFKTKLWKSPRRHRVAETESQFKTF